MKQFLGIIGIIGGTVLLIFGLISLSAKKEARVVEKYTNLTSREVALLCTTDMATKYHIHPNIQITINGENFPLPASMGVAKTCMNSIHTHDGGGLVHVEAPIEKAFTVGDVFAVWGKEFSKDKILDAVVDGSHLISMSVNGQNVDTFEETILEDEAKIVIEYKVK